MSSICLVTVWYFVLSLTSFFKLYPFEEILNKWNPLNVFLIVIFFLFTLLLNYTFLSQLPTYFGNKIFKHLSDSETTIGESFTTFKLRSSEIYFCMLCTFYNCIKNLLLTNWSLGIQHLEQLTWDRNKRKEKCFLGIFLLIYILISKWIWFSILANCSENPTSYISS